MELETKCEVNPNNEPMRRWNVWNSKGKKKNCMKITNILQKFEHIENG